MIYWNEIVLVWTKQYIPNFLRDGFYNVEKLSRRQWGRPWKTPELQTDPRLTSELPVVQPKRWCGRPREVPLSQPSRGTTQCKIQTHNSRHQYHQRVWLDTHQRKPIAIDHYHHYHRLWQRIFRTMVTRHDWLKWLTYTATMISLATTTITQTLYSNITIITDMTK